MNMRVYFRGVVEDGDTVARFGAATPAETTVTGNADASPTRIVVPAGLQVVLWKYQDNVDETFELLHARIVDGSYAVVSMLCAQPTSTTNLLPVATATTKWRWRNVDMSQAAPFILSSDEAYIATGTSLDDDAGNSTNSGYATTMQALIDGAYPALWDHETTGRIYKVVITNPDTENDITVEFGVVR